MFFHYFNAISIRWSYLNLVNGGVFETLHGYQIKKGYLKVCKTTQLYRFSTKYLVKNEGVLTGFTRLSKEMRPVISISENS